MEDMTEEEKCYLLQLIMEDVRGNWCDPADRIDAIRSLCGRIGTLPKEFLEAVKYNADTFDGKYNDGRIFRDGQLKMDAVTIKGLGLPKEMEGGVSGNMAKMMGAKPVKIEGYYGTYNELAKLRKSGKQLGDEFWRLFDKLMTYPPDSDVVLGGF
jgi:hypothetical protein